MTDDHLRTGEQLALVLTDYGMPRMNARLIAALLVTDRDTVTQGELSEDLGAAAGSVSAAINVALRVGLAERVPMPGSRREHYRLRNDAWARLFTEQNQATSDMLAAARATRDAVDADSPAHRRLSDMCDFYEYLLAELPAILDRWQASRRRS
jgi:DNA-binding transcriptional regulator GbsR (MarR family)